METRLFQIVAQNLSNRMKIHHPLRISSESHLLLIWYQTSTQDRSAKFRTLINFNYFQLMMNWCTFRRVKFEFKQQEDRSSGSSISYKNIQRSFFNWPTARIRAEIVSR